MILRKLVLPSSLGLTYISTPKTFFVAEIYFPISGHPNSQMELPQSFYNGNTGVESIPLTRLTVGWGTCSEQDRSNNRR